MIIQTQKKRREHGGDFGDREIHLHQGLSCNSSSPSKYPKFNTGRALQISSNEESAKGQGRT